MKTRSVISLADEVPEAERWAFMVWHAMYREGGGGNPSAVLDTLSGMVDKREELGLGTPEALAAAVLSHDENRGIHHDDLRTILIGRHHKERDGSEPDRVRLERMRAVIRHEVLHPEMGTPGRPTEGTPKPLDSKDYGEGETYLTRRIRRDRPDLYEEIRAGNLSASKAANLAGITKQRRSVRIDNPHAAVNGLLRWFTVEELREALDDLDGDA